MIEKISKIALAVVLLAPWLVAPGLAQEADQDLKDEIGALKLGQESIRQQIELKNEIEELKKGQAEIQKQLEEVKSLLELHLSKAPTLARPKLSAPVQPSIKGVKLDLGDNPIRGDSTAKVTIVEFTDYQCVVCLRHARNTYPQIQKEYVETGKVKYSVIDLPLETIHPNAFKAAEATHCAEDQGKFWEMHDHLFENRMLADLSPHAKAIGLDVEKFEDCLASGRYEAAVRQDLALAAQAGAVRTPTFVIAASDRTDLSKVEGLVLIPGAKDWPPFQRAIEQALAEVSK